MPQGACLFKDFFAVITHGPILLESVGNKIGPLESLQFRLSYIICQKNHESHQHFHKYNHSEVDASCEGQDQVATILYILQAYH